MMNVETHVIALAWIKLWELEWKDIVDITNTSTNVIHHIDVQFPTHAGGEAHNIGLSIKVLLAKFEIVFASENYEEYNSNLRNLPAWIQKFVEF